MVKDEELRSPWVVAEEGPIGDGHINVGAEYQATIPEIGDIRGLQLIDSEVYWEPPPSGINMSQLDEYIECALERYGITEDQSLAMLMLKGYDFDHAREQFAEYELRNGDFSEHAGGLPTTGKCMTECHWCRGDCSCFETSLFAHSKDFDRVCHLLGDLPLCEVIGHYYQWKRYRDQCSHQSAPISHKRGVQRNFQALMLFPQCSYCGVLEAPSEKNCQPVEEAEVKRGGTDASECDNCAHLAKLGWKDDVPFGLYFNMQEFQEIITDEAASKRKDREMRMKWIMTIRKFQKLKQQRETFRWPK